jgi:hypothetical protein
VSPHEAFISVINEQPELFSTEDREDLAQQKWSDDIDELEDQIFEWSYARENIYDAALKSLSGKENDRNNRLPGNGTKAPEIKPEDYKPMLLNAIHRSFNTPQPATAATNSR